MAVKRICGRRNSRYLKCLRCDKPIEEVLRDDVVYTCPTCGQVHLVDIYDSRIALTAAEYAEFRRRHGITKEEAAARAARKALLERAEQRRKDNAKYQEWLEELATQQEEYIENEFSYMGEEMAAVVADYLNNNGFSVTKDDFSKYRVKREA